MRIADARVPLLEISRFAADVVVLLCFVWFYFSFVSRRQNIRSVTHLIVQSAECRRRGKTAFKNESELLLPRIEYALDVDEMQLFGNNGVSKSKCLYGLLKYHLEHKD